MKKYPDRLELLAELAMGKLRGKQKALIEKELETDEELRELYLIIKGLYSEGRNRDWEQVYQSAIEMSSKMFDDIQDSLRKGGKARGITIFDSGFVPLPDGIRPAAVDTRRMRYVIGDHEVEVSIYPVSSDSYEVIGRLTGQVEGGLKIQLISGKTKFICEMDEFNLFRFPRVPSLDYTLEISSGTGVIGNIDLKL